MSLRSTSPSSQPLANESRFTGSGALAKTLAFMPSLIIAGSMSAQTAEPAAAPQAPTGNKVELPAVTVEGTAQPKLSSPKFTAPLVDTPQTVVVIPSEVYTQQGAATLSDVLRNTPGITFLAGEGGGASNADGDSFFMRGFDTSGSIFVDGIRDSSQISRDVYNIEQVEVAKGPAGSDVGRTTASGYVNLSSKTPRLQSFQAGTVSYGFDETDAAARKRVTLDINQPLANDTVPGTAFRLNLMAQDGGVTGRDYAENNKFGIAPSLAFGLGTSTRLVTSYEYYEHNNVPDYGLPLAALPGNGFYTPAAPAIEQDTFFGHVTDSDDATSHRYSARIEHDLTPDLLISNQSRYTDTDRSVLLTSPGTSPASYNAATGLLARSRQANDRENESFANLTNLIANFSTGIFDHSVSTGVEYIYERQFTTSYGSLAVPGTPITNPNIGGAIPVPVPSGATAEADISTIGIYLFDTIDLSKAWQLTGGFRWETYDADYTSVSTTNVVTESDARESILSWKGGLVFKPAANGSIYTAYGVAVRPPGSDFAASTGATNANNLALEPQEAFNYELGTKWEFLERRLGLTAALFRTENTNVAAVDGLGNVSQVVDQIVQGLELGASGQITENWLVFAGFAYMDSEQSIPSFTTGAANDGNELQRTPEFSGNVWTTYRLPFGLTVGGGGQYVGETERSNNTLVPGSAAPTVPSYWLFSAMTSYEVNKHLTLRLNVDNLFDEDYIRSLNNNGGRYNPGAGRSYLISAEMKF